MWIEFEHKNKLYKVCIEYVEPKWFEKIFRWKSDNDYYIHIEEVTKTGNKSVIKHKFYYNELIFACNDIFNQSLKDMINLSDEKYKQYLIKTSTRLLNKKERLSRLVKE